MSTTLTMTLRGAAEHKRWVVRCGLFAPVMLCPEGVQQHLDITSSNEVVRCTFFNKLPATVSRDEAFTFTRNGDLQGVDCHNAALQGLIRYLYSRGYRYVVPWVEE